MNEERPDREAEVVLVGRSNVGKSTLMRELTGSQVATGRRPGVTRAPVHYDWNSPSLLVTDLPGFGFMEGVPSEVREQIKTDVVRYLEDNAEGIILAILVLDGKSAVEIIDRHAARGELPHDVELFSFLRELAIPTIVAVNKMDKVGDRDARLDAIADRLGLPPPWQQWRDTIAPITAKRGQLASLHRAMRERLESAGRMDVFGRLA